MKIVVGVTDNRWAEFLRDRADIVEANFWQPSPHGFKALPEGGPFLFKTKDPSKYRTVDIPGYSLVGGGFFDLGQGARRRQLPVLEVEHVPDRSRCRAERRTAPAGHAPGEGETRAAR